MIVCIDRTLIAVGSFPLVPNASKKLVLEKVLLTLFFGLLYQHCGSHYLLQCAGHYHPFLKTRSLFGVFLKTEQFPVSQDFGRKFEKLFLNP